MDRLDAIRIFVRVVESGSFSSVAREIGVGQPAISKQIAALEAHLGAVLMRRTSRCMTLTEAGQDFYESSVRLIEELDAAESRVGRGQTSPSGLIKVTIAPVFSRLYVTPRLGEFFGRYPGISIEVIVTDRQVNLVEEGVDLCVHNGETSQADLVVREIAKTSVVTVATPAYLAAHGEPTSVAALDQHACVIFAPQGPPKIWSFKEGLSHNPRGAFRSHDAEQIRAATLAGLGIAHTPRWLFSKELASGEVRLVLDDFAPAPIAISLLYPARRRQATKIRVFVDFLTEIISEQARDVQRSEQPGIR